MSDMPEPDPAEIVKLLQQLPRVKITPETITQHTIDKWYEREREYRAEVERLTKERNDARALVRAHIEGDAPGAQAAEIARLTEERDLAIAHDRQPYPTAWAYEQVVKALETQHQRTGQAERIIARVRQMADAWERRLPATILTATAVEALRTATERYALDQPDDQSRRPDQ